MTERIAYLIGWLEGFSYIIWALAGTHDGERLIAVEEVDKYDEVVKQLKDELSKLRLGVSDTGPYTVKTVPLSTPPIDLTPKVTFKSGEDA